MEKFVKIGFFILLSTAENHASYVLVNEGELLCNVRADIQIVLPGNSELNGFIVIR